MDNTMFNNLTEEQKFMYMNMKDMEIENPEDNVEEVPEDFVVKDVK